MRSAQLIEEDELAGGDAELNLGMGSLIGIFFGLALVCGVFFGFGYMLGHRPSGPYISSEPLYESPQPAATAPKPSAQYPQQPAAASRVIVPATAAMGTIEAPPEVTVLPSAPMATSPAAAAVAPRSRAAAGMTQTAQPTPIAADGTPAAESRGGVMVQIAAVRNHADAEALAAALRKNGFNPITRTEPQDKLLHVQVGPFQGRDEAKAMRQKLSSAGYNAFIK